MINLIPPHARKTVKVEYWIRVISVWMLLFACACLIVCILFVPSAVVIRSEILLVESSFQDASDRNSAYKQLEDDIKIANSISTQLTTRPDDGLFTKLTSELRGLMQPGVVLDSISLGRTEGVVETVKITGEAGSRTYLASLKDRIEAHPSFESADLPLSNLAKDIDIPFSITIVISNEIYN